MPKLTTGEIAELIGGRLVGSSDIAIFRLSSLKSARRGDLSFLADKRHAKLAQETLASAVFVSEEGVDSLPGSITKIICQNPYLAFAKTIDSFMPN
ncbi:MAG: LpxD N-terminal domain-containing protein, partial [Betaproteobacteria bacterium]